MAPLQQASGAEAETAGCVGWVSTELYAMGVA